MKLNMDLCRTILLQVEHLDDGANDDLVILVPGFDERVVNYHLRALTEGGFVNSHAVPDTIDGTDHILPFALTWRGHQFIATIRDDTLWANVKRVAVNKTGTLTFDIISALATSLLKQSLGLQV